MVFGNRRGIALIAVLWVVTLLAVIAASFTTTTRTGTRLARNLVDNAKAEAMADAGVYRAILELLTPGSAGLFTPEIGGLLALGGGSEAALRRSVEDALRPAVGTEVERTPGAEGEARFRAAWRVDGTVYAWRFGGGEVLVSIQDEAGKIDLNRAPDALLKGLFAAAGVDEDEAAALADAVADFRDANDLRRLNGAEDDDYRDAGLAWGAKDRPFEAVEELQRVLGMTGDLYARVAPALTVHSRRRRVNPATAPLLVLRALPGLDPAEIEALLAERQEEEIGDEAGEPGAAGIGTVGAELPISRSRSPAFTIRAEAHTETGAVFVREAVVRLVNDREPYRIEAWRRGRRTERDGESEETE